MMKKSIAACSLVFMTTLTGCASLSSETTTDAIPPAVVYGGMTDLPFTTLEIYDQPLVSNIDLQKAGVLTTTSSSSRAVAWQVPAYGAYRFNLNSFVSRSHFGRKASAFMADVQLLDKDFNVLKTLPASALQYQKPTLMGREFVYHSFVVDNRDPMVTPVAYILVSMDDESREHTIVVVDEDKEYAKARGLMEPVTPDVLATASELGSLSLEATPLQTSYTRTTPQQVIDSTYRPPVMPAKAVTLKTFDTVGVSKAYLDSVRSHLSSGDVTTALQMRQNVKALHASLQQQFAKLYGKAADSVEVMDTLPKDLTITEQLNHAYSQQMNVSFREQSNQAALALIDQLGVLVNHVNELF